ncbi:MAG: sulfur oxidation c-type cytochrome SoxX [Sulfurovum sp.]|nr:sulfur oxidation c-type cytochrome SoxX [Sulfurovum sp.]
MHMTIKHIGLITLFVSGTSSLIGADLPDISHKDIATVSNTSSDLTKSYDMPNASRMIEKDLLKDPQRYVMPKSCNLSDPESIARGAYIFHNLNGRKAKKVPPKGLSKFIEVKGKDGKMKKKPKQYGNCVACHNIEGAKGAGNIGPDLSNYKTIFLDTKTRDYQFVYQKIADPRIDNPDSNMIVNLTTGLFNEQEICDLVAYVTSDK